MGRLFVWTLVLYSLVKLAKELEIKWYSFALGLGIWLYVSSKQYLVASESLFGGVEQKCLAYAFVFLSLTSLLRHQTVRAGIFCGISISLHVLVGGWAAIAMTGALRSVIGRVRARWLKNPSPWSTAQSWYEISVRLVPDRPRQRSLHQRPSLL